MLSKNALIWTGLIYNFEMMYNFERTEDFPDYNGLPYNEYGFFTFTSILNMKKSSVLSQFYIIPKVVDKEKHSFKKI